MKARLKLKILLLCSLLQGALLSCECPKTSTCPLLLYEDGRAVKDHLFKPCEQSCDICVDGWSAQIESINCPKNSALECACASSNNGDVHLKPRDPDSPTLEPGEHSFEIKLSYECFHSGSPTSSIKKKEVSVTVTVRVIEVQLNIMTPESSRIEGENMQFECNVLGPVPGEGLVLVYYHHDTRNKQLACADNTLEGVLTNMHGTSTMLNRTDCQLDMSNCEVSDSGYYSCNVIISGITEPKSFSS